MGRFALISAALCIFAFPALSAADEESVGSPLLAEASSHEPPSPIPPPPLVLAEGDSPVADAPTPAPQPAPVETSPVHVSAPASSTAPISPPSPAQPSGAVDARAPEVVGQSPLRAGRFFAQTQGALTAGTSQSLALSLTASGGYLFTPQVAAGAQVVWSSTGGGSQIGGGAFATYHLSFGNPRIVPAISGGVTIFSTSIDNVSHTGFLVNATGQIEAFLTDSVAVVPYATVGVGNLVGDPTIQFQIGWALAVYF